MEKEKGCTCGEEHVVHICMLRSKGLIGMIEQMTGCPNVACAQCGEEADSEDHVCSPLPLFI